MNVERLSGMNSQNLINLQGGFSRITSANKLFDDFKVLLETQKGTVIGDPAFGSDLYALLFQPANEATASSIRYEVANAIDNYYENVIVESVDVTFKNKTILLAIHYKLQNTNVGDTVMLEFIRGY